MHTVLYENLNHLIHQPIRLHLVTRKERYSSQHPNPAQQERLWMMPSISTLITCKTLHCCAPSITSTQKKTINQPTNQPTSNPQNPGANNGIRKDFAGFARVIKFPKPCPGSLKFAQLLHMPLRYNWVMTKNGSFRCFFGRKRVYLKTIAAESVLGRI